MGFRRVKLKSGKRVSAVISPGSLSPTEPKVEVVDEDTEELYYEIPVGVGVKTLVGVKINSSMRYGAGEWDKVPIQVTVEKTFTCDEGSLVAGDGPLVDAAVDAADTALQAAREFVRATHADLFDED